MQIRLTVVDPLGPTPHRGRAASRDVLVTAPAGTDLAAVASALASAVTGEGGPGRDTGGSPVVLYAGTDRLDPRRHTLGEPPLVDGAVLSLGAPAAPEPHPELDDAPTQLHVVAGPDAGGVHLLHGGRITVGRSADADVPLDDPDVSRLHCAVTVAADGRVSVADLGSTNGTALDGTRVDERPVRFSAGALLRIGESALRVTPSGGPGARVRTVPDGEGCVRVALEAGGANPAANPAAGPDAAGHPRVAPLTGGPTGATHHAYGAAGWGAGAQEHRRRDQQVVPGQAGAPNIERREGGAGAPQGAPGGTLPPPGAPARGGDTHAGHYGIGGPSGLSGSAYPGTAAHGPAPDGTYPAADAARGAYGTARGAEAARGAESAPGAEAGRRTEAARGPEAARGTYGTAPGAEAARGAEAAPGTGAARGAYDTARRTEAARGAETAPRAEAARRTEAAPGAEAVRRTEGAHGAAAERRTEAARGGRKDTPLHGTDLPEGGRRRGGIGAWARRLAGGRGEQQAAAREAYGAPVEAVAAAPAADVTRAPETWPDPAALLLTALGPGPRLWERGPGHPEALTVRLGTADRSAPDGSGVLPAVPVTAALREAGALGLAGPRPRLAGLARAVLAQLAALHSPDLLEIVLISADRARPVEERAAEWSWLGWLPHVRPGHGQDCRLLLAHDREQAAARTEELLRRVEEYAATGRGAAQPAPARQAPAGDGTAAAPDPTAPETPTAGTSAFGAPAAPQAPDAPDAPAAAGSAQRTAPGRRPSWAREDAGLDGGGGFPGPYTVVVVDGDPGGSSLQESLARLAVAGPRAGIHVLCLAETEAATPASPVARTYEEACALTPTFRHCGAVALLSGDVAGALHLMRVAPTGPVEPGAPATVDAVSAAWAERFARALAPLRPDGPAGERHARVAVPLPQSARLLDELGLARATPASLMARWADAADDTESLGGRARAVLGAGPRGPLTADLVAEGPHLLIEGPAGSGRTELLRSVVASLAAAERPDRLGMVLIDGRDGVGTGAGLGEGLRVCTDIPHVTTHLIANDPVRMREFAQSLSAELKRRAELLGRTDFTQWHSGREVSGRIVAQRTPGGRPAAAPAPSSAGAGDIESPPSSTMRLRPGAAARRRTEAAPPLPRLVVVVDDLDALVSPALGSPGRPAAGSVLRALEAVAREGERLGVHLVAAAGAGGRTAETEPARRADLRISLDAPSAGPDEPAPGRGRLTYADGRAVGFQGGRVTGRIPRTATQRPTVVPLEWQRMGDPPTRRPVRELGNGPTDLALLASAVERAAREVAAAEVPSLL
ncbi:FHA domain-containing protein [Streptomyces collinus]|uniref:FHA domain-containing protein n=1 Tax=Streptomyces collinus TaxID=42684 RepID=UPI0036334E73